VVLGNAWWKSEAASYAGYVYKPLTMTAAVDGGGLDLKLVDPGWVKQRKLDDFIPDHDHLMHLYMIRWPEMDAVFHLHPEQTGTGEFRLQLPSVPAGDYRLYADVVHAQGFPETVVGDVTLPAIAGRALSGDDAAGVGVPVSQSQAAGAGERRFALPDGYTMVWKRPTALLVKQLESFEFELVDRAGKPASDMALYMGMPGHAAFVKTDGSVFAHIHPNGTMAMAAFMMANGVAAGHASMSMTEMSGMKTDAAIPATVSFPYGFPTAGRYRIFVQMKHGKTVETGVFDADVAGPAGGAS